jgi:oligoribonuclease NrnB/cAMP/cGMP phosphodiesterase (DHH superfamily)
VSAFADRAASIAELERRMAEAHKGTDRIVIAHADCVDGFTAAWVAHRVYGDAAEYVFAKYGDAPPDVSGKDVLIVDFSYPRAVLLEMKAAANSLHVLDHHKSAAKDLDGLDFCTFDMNRSGAMMTWNWLEGHKNVPQLVRYVQDRDLWKWELQESKEISAWLSIIRRDFGVWEATAEKLEKMPCAVAALGTAILGHVDAYVESTAKNARLYVVDEQTVPFVNAPGMMASELIGKLAETAPFAVGFFQRADGKWQYSLRSRGEYDVSVLAERHGGGGHRGAAGFEHACPPDELFFRPGEEPADAE